MFEASRDFIPPFPSHLVPDPYPPIPPLLPSPKSVDPSFLTPLYKGGPHSTGITRTPTLAQNAFSPPPWKQLFLNTHGMPVENQSATQLILHTILVY